MGSIPSASPDVWRGDNGLWPGTSRQSFTLVSRIGASCASHGLAKGRILLSHAPPAATAPRPTGGRGGPQNHRPDIQGLRALAVLMVVAFHAGLPVPGGFVGVDVFFVISGFVITAMLMREWSSTGSVRMARFYVRRFKRLTPALALTVTFVVIVSFLLLSPFGSQQTAVKTAIGAMLLAANVMIARTTGDYFDAPAESNPLLNTWSLSVEEQFYLVFPAILLIGWQLGQRIRRPQRAAVLVVGLVGAVSLFLALAGSIGVSIPFVPESLVGFYGPTTRAWEFAAGALLALGGAKYVVPQRLALSAVLAGAAMLAAALCLISGTTPFPGVWTLLPVIGTLLLIAAGSNTTILHRVLGSEQMVAIGDRSYSIYLWHWPFIVFAQVLWPQSPMILVAAAGLSLIPAYASYRWVEQPIRTLPVARGFALGRLVAAIVIPPIVLAGALGVAARAGFWNSTVQDYQAAILPSHAGAAADCTEQAWEKPADCTWNGQASGQPVYLVGDSNADHFIEPLINAARIEGRPLVSLTEDGCSYLPPTTLEQVEQIDQEGCGLYPTSTQEFLQTAVPGLVVVANSYYKATPRAEVAAQDESIPDIGSALDDLSSRLSAAVRSLQDAGHSVLLVQTIPHWGQKESLNWQSCSVLHLLTDECARALPLEDTLQQQGPAAEVVAAVAASTGADLLDLSTEICPNGTCSSISADGLIRYRDGTHITVPQSQELTSVFHAAMVSAT